MDTRIRNDADQVHLTLRHLSYFIAVAEERHFSRAAERLHISQPPLTQRIQELERDLGVQLFARTGSPIELTEAGRLIFAEAKTALAQIDRIREMARRIRQGEAGILRVRVGALAFLVQAFRESMEAFRRDYPNVILDLVQITCSHALEELKQGKIDACVIRRTKLDIDGLSHVIIARDRLMFALPSSHPKARAEKVALHDVVEERFIQFGETSTGTRKQIEELWTRHGLEPPVNVLIGQGALPILSMVAGGVGNAILPSTANQIQIPAPNVVWKSIDVSEQWISGAVVMLYRTDTQNKNIQSRFVDYVRRFSCETTMA